MRVIFSGLISDSAGCDSSVGSEMRKTDALVSFSFDIACLAISPWRISPPYFVAEGKSAIYCYSYTKSALALNRCCPHVVRVDTFYPDTIEAVICKLVKSKYSGASFV